MGKILKKFYEMLRSVSSSTYHDQMMHFVKPLKDHFGINHFWYYRVLNTGYYTYLGTNNEWSEYCFEHHLLSQFPILRNPQTQKSGIVLMKNTTNIEFMNVQKMAWEKFHVNFNLNISTKLPNGIEAFGFATQSDDPRMDEYMLNELSLLGYFIRTFRKNYRKLFDIIFDNQVDISSYFGSKFYQEESPCSYPKNRKGMLQKLGYNFINTFTQRERSVVALLSKGYPAPYIAKVLQISRKTVENYIAVIKCKFYCSSKVELLHKAQEYEAVFKHHLDI